MSIFNRHGDYAWGSECAGGLAVGLSVDGKEFNVSSPVRWRWALRNDSSEARQVTIDYDLDRSFRYRLQIFKPGSTVPISEFPPPLREPPTTSNFSQDITLKPEKVIELEAHDALIGVEQGPGIYHLRVLFGGPDFNFECTSGLVEIRIK